MWEYIDNTIISYINLKQLVQRYADKRVKILPLKPNTRIKQDDTGEHDIVFTGNVLYEIQCNEDIEYITEEELKQIIADVKTMKRAEKERCDACRDQRIY